MSDNILYSDKLVEIDDNSIVVRNYYYPFGDKRINYDNVDKIIVQKPTLRSGKYRVWGTGDFHTWYPPDDRTLRDKIFIIKIKKKWWCVGLTVENSQTVLSLLKDKCSILDNSF
jgi:hypothetical protein